MRIDLCPAVQQQNVASISIVIRIQLRSSIGDLALEVSE